MRIFQSSLSYKTFELIDTYFPNIKINLLRSFGLNDAETFRILQDFPHLIDMKILDSGVWSKFNIPETIQHEVEDYGKFLPKHADKFDCYFNYDEDFKEIEKDHFGSKNDDNQRYLENLGLNPVPVLHNLETTEINKYIELRQKYPFIAIGSNAISNKNFEKSVKDLKAAGIKTHAFKIGSADKLQGLEVWSSDCSSHAQWTKNGRVVFFDNKTKKDKALSFRPFTKKAEPNEDYFRESPLLDSYTNFLENMVGIEIQAVIKNSDFRTFSNSIYFWWLERYVTCHNQGLGITFVDDLQVDCQNLVNPFD